MKKVKCFDVVEELIIEGSKQFSPFYRVNEENVKILAQYCNCLDTLCEKFDGESYEIEINDLDLTIQIVMECLIGSECYNPNSYDGYQEIEGCSFRYPVMIPNEEGVYQKTKCNIGELAYRFKEPVTYESVQYMKYKFGSNDLFIDQGLVKVLKFLEQRYNLDFNELEKSRR